MYMGGFSVEEIGMSTVGGVGGVFGNPPPDRSVITGGKTCTGGPITTTDRFQGGVLDSLCVRSGVSDDMTTGRSMSGSRSNGVSVTDGVSGGMTRSGGATGGVSATDGVPGGMTRNGGSTGGVSATDGVPGGMTSAVRQK